MFNKSMNFIRNINRENFYFSNQSFPIWWLNEGRKVMRKTQFQLNICKIMPRPKNIGTYM